MKLSISNIGWEAKDDFAVYERMKNYGFQGLEIAPTRIIPEAPYDNNDIAVAWSEKLKKDYGFSVPSMQSIWFGRQERIFGTKEERKILIDYTKKAIDFAAAIDCKNLVFGCPRNRNLPEGADAEIAVHFFKELGEYACSRGTTIGMEANPTIYNTNYINDTAAALHLIQEVNCEGFRLNLDVGTMIHNGESVDILRDKVHFINHVHISEPGLKPIIRRGLHKELKALLQAEGYCGYVSIEMGKTDNAGELEQIMSYLRWEIG